VKREIYSNPKLTEEEAEMCESLFETLQGLLHKGLCFNEKEREVGISLLQQILHPNQKEAIIYINSDEFTYEIVLYMVASLNLLFENPGLAVITLSSLREKTERNQRGRFI